MRQPEAITTLVSEVKAVCGEAVLKAILETGALLENETFFLAQRIISHFNDVSTADAVVLNGLPRHEAQAKDVAPWFDIRLVIRLECNAQTVFERIRLNSGKDRTDREDDGVELVEKKLKIFETRTAPLCDWFSSQGIQVVGATVGVQTQPAYIVQQIENKMARFVL